MKNIKTEHCYLIASFISFVTALVFLLTSQKLLSVVFLGNGLTMIIFYDQEKKTSRLEENRKEFKQEKGSEFHDNWNQALAYI